MENASDALKIGFAILVFVASISMAFLSITQAVETSDIVTHYLDRTNFYPQYKEKVNSNNSSVIDIEKEYNSDYIMSVTKQERNRIVGASTVISNLYKYHKESFCVIINKSNGTNIARFDLDSENSSSDTAPWLIGSNKDREIQKRIDWFLSGQTGEINGKQIIFGGTSGSPANSERSKYYNAKESFGSYMNKKFQEQFIEVNTTGNQQTATDGSSIILASGGKKIYIIYTVVDNI